MTPGALLQGVLEDARRSTRSLVGGALGIALGLMCVVFFGALGLGIRDGFVGRALAHLPAGTVEVRPKGGVPVGFLRFEGSDLIIRPLDAAAAESLAAVPGVAHVYPRVAALFPMRAQGGRSLLGRDVYTDVFASGVDSAFVAEDLPKGTVFEDNPNGPIPCLVSSQLIELFNRAVAPSLGVPGLTEDAIVGFAFTLVLGESYSSGRNSGGKSITVQVVGVSEKAMMLGITVPRATAERWNATHAAQPPRGFGSAYVVTQDGAALSGVIKAAEGMGYVVEQNSKLAATLVTGLMSTWLLVAVLILVVAGFNVAQTLSARVESRRKELGLMRAVGATRADVANLILMEALLMAMLAAAVGIMLGVGAAYTADAVAARYLPRIPFQPDSWFLFPWWLLALAALSAVTCAMLGAWPPARKASRLDPARALEG
jgi:hypothetical protein